MVVLCAVTLAHYIKFQMITTLSLSMPRMCSMSQSFQIHVDSILILLSKSNGDCQFLKIGRDAELFALRLSRSWQSSAGSADLDYSTSRWRNITPVSNTQWMKPWMNMVQPNCAYAKSVNRAF